MCSITVVAFLAVAASASAASFSAVTLGEFETFKQEYGKKYDTYVEEQFRMKIYMENKYKIAKHNLLYYSDQSKYTLKMNEFGDLLHVEFVSMMNGWRGNITGGFYKNNRRYNGSTFIGLDDDVLLPKNVDWREKGAVTPVKNQGHCGSCWSFSATGALEGQHFRKTGDLVSLSEQNLMDCSMAYGNNGCNGGLMDYAFMYVKDNHGIDTEGSYPYEAQNDTCRYNPDDSGADDTGFVDIREGSEDELKQAIAIVGPVSIAIDASHESFQFYHNGMYNEPDCTAENIDHGVLAVGYGITEDGDEYWLVKNSWGTSWGDEGYIKIPRNKDNYCGIASAASYPLV